MKREFLIAVVLLVGGVTANADNTGVDPAQPYAYGGNVGWLNVGATNGDVRVHFDGDAGWLSGHAWGETFGWLKLGSDEGGPYANTSALNWGVNIAADGTLSGYAWGRNVGWVNFGGDHCDAAVSTTTGEFSGHAWGENIGWLKFRGASPDYGVRTLAFDTQAQGTPNWWLALHGVDEAFDAGDGVPAWQKYVMDTDPKTPGDVLRVLAVEARPSGAAVVFSPTSTKRRYTLLRRDNLSSGDWSDVEGQTEIAGQGGDQVLQDPTPAPQAFYTVKVRAAP